MIQVFCLRVSLIIILASLVSSCVDKADDDHRPVSNPPPSAHLYLKIEFDSTQSRLDNNGNNATIPFNHGAQSPDYNSINIGYIELLTDSTMPYGEGVNLFHSLLGTNGTDTAYSCCTNLLPTGYEFQAYVDTSHLPNDFKYIRIYFVYQNYDIIFQSNGNSYTATLASFVAPSTFTYDFTIKDSSYTGYDLKTNGEWYLEADTPNFGTVLHGFANTTQPNVLYSSFPTPANSCIVTCAINPVIHIEENNLLHLNIFISANNSFEWIENSSPGFFEPFDGDTIYDIGIRGVNVKVQ